MVIPSNLAFHTTSIGFPLTIIGEKSGAHLAKDIRSYLHFDSFSWNLFVWYWVVISITASWILLVWFLATHSAMVVPSTYFHRSKLVTSISSIIRRNSHGPSFVPEGHLLVFPSITQYKKRLNHYTTNESLGLFYLEQFPTIYHLLKHGLKRFS